MRKFRPAICIMVVLAVFAGSDVLAGVIQARNEIVIIPDASGSFRNRQEEAIKRSVELLEDIAKQKLHRWEDNKDRVVIISLDALPEVVWAGSLRDLKTASSKSWADRFRARTDYASCTDVGAAFNLATHYLDGSPMEVNRHLFVFSDLINEPPTKSIRHCQPAHHPSPPPDDFPWEKLQGVTVNIFWVPVDQKLTWSKAAEQHGLKDSFALFTPSESSVTPILPPEPAHLAPKVIEEQRQKTAQQVKDFGGKILKWAGLGLGLIFFLIVLAILGTILLSRSRSNRRIAEPQVDRRVIGPVPPLNLAGRQRPPAASPVDRGRRGDA